MTTVRPLTRTLGAPQSIQGIPFAPGTDVYVGLDDRLTLCVIPEDQEILGIPCARGLVHFHPTGEVAQATLSRPATIRGAWFNAGTVVSWSEDGTLAAHVLDEHTIGDVPVPCRGHVVLGVEGGLMRWSRRLEGAEIIAGIPCQAGCVATFYANGQPERLTTGSNVEIDGLVALAGTDIEFHDNGRVSVITVAEPCERGGIQVDEGTPLIFREDGTLSVVHLVDDLDVDGVVYPAGTYLQFNEREQLSSHVTLSWSVGSYARAERV